MKNTKKVYSFNAKKYVSECKELGIEADIQWAIKHNGKLVLFNEEIGLGVLDGKLITKALCDDYKYDIQALCSEKNTELEKVLHRTSVGSVLEIRDLEEKLEELNEELNETLEFVEKLMESHNMVLEVMRKHRASLSEQFVKDMFKEVVSKVMISIIEDRV